MTPETEKRNLTRLDIPTLVSLSHQALAEEDAPSAVIYMRTAVRRAPLRQDLRLLLYQAIEQSVGSGDYEAARDALGTLGQGASGELAEGGRDSAQGGELWNSAVVEGEEEDEEEGYVRIESDGGPASRPSPHPAGLAHPASRGMRAGAGRHRSSPGSRSLGTIIALIGFAVAAVGLGFAFFVGPGESPKEAASEQADKIIADQDAAIMQMAREYEDQDLFDEAIEKLILLTDGPDKQNLLADAYARRGDRFTRASRYNSAEQSYQTALAYRPDDARLSYDLGMTYYTLGRQNQLTDRQAAGEHFAQAERQLQIARDLDPKSLKTLDALAHVEIARRNSAAAAEYLRRIVELDPDSKDAKDALSTMKQMGIKP